ncbi:hypothetical protein E3E31_00360 [Thermococcus sp. M39]|uniref:hypothetical protein n=1 Tax=unclassified Thermococcus TaxID=2627626 RepID=UPI0014397D9A|nr:MULTISPECIES: hypothetical protein [unclassified Thermococcus]NJE07007.1 hypothetical protein [Thermococcus sp. M39]NJE12907.1 hypothetical protein [Thermococcus sp. LS2]
MEGRALINLGIPQLDKIIGGIEDGSLIALIERDPRSLGSLISLLVAKKKLEEGHLVVLFNKSLPLPVLLNRLESVGINVDRYLGNGQLAILDVFDSYYEVRYDIPNVFYIKGGVQEGSYLQKSVKEVLSIKREWVRRGLIDENKELWGINYKLSDYLDIFSEHGLIKIIETTSEIRFVHEAYTKYPKGTNIWVFSGNNQTIINLLYRRADYVIETRSILTEEGVKRELYLIKMPKMGRIRRFTYQIKGNEFRIV